uniref:Uncharacterized protein n=1 Tax=Ditylenchus dipsaci TaxID=166011 RepID=A0A915CX36_9BILA
MSLDFILTCVVGDSLISALRLLRSDSVAVKALYCGIFIRENTEHQCSRGIPFPSSRGVTRALRDRPTLFSFAFSKSFNFNSRRCANRKWSQCEKKNRKYERSMISCGKRGRVRYQGHRQEVCGHHTHCTRGLTDRLVSQLVDARDGSHSRNRKLFRNERKGKKKKRSVRRRNRKKRRTDPVPARKEAEKKQEKAQPHWTLQVLTDRVLANRFGISTEAERFNKLEPACGGKTARKESLHSALLYTHNLRQGAFFPGAKVTKDAIYFSLHVLLLPIYLPGH